ncbi:nucleoside-diphosphate kinase [Candidatus Galacturonibacter soehngenii]|uniref:nucleoside-diphosphate kinase n=1 Tax=Candidatus Galacturonatibacter soehngenii TaxID=2307010 RepID=A0A7V7QMA7_9FIRM|nr:nucleoside-diphosphate kinase [Candidatus Galacturonibacter soehngenii]KAB1439780.1 nucleoside-diphosphate kinase [Candidatus Galacturonibacter soehngenii]
MERTLVIIKPEAVAKKIVGKIISVYEDNHLNIIHAHRVLPTRDVLEKHYEAHKDKDFFESLISFMSSSEVMVLILEGKNVVNTVREINGSTNPEKAKPGTLRYMFGENVQENAVHGSESLEVAEKEIRIWRDLIRFES